jgi:hypothetical protein
MENFQTFENFYSHSLFMRIVSISVLVMFCFVMLLGFSMFMELKPKKAQAFWPVIDFSKIASDIGHWFSERAWEFVKAVAKAFVLKFINNLLIKAMQKLESLHVIKNFLYYSDALGFDQYIGSALNKELGLSKQSDVMAVTGNIDAAPPTSTSTAETTAEPVDLASLAFQTSGIAALTPRQVQGLANLSFLPSASATSTKKTLGLTAEQEKKLLRGGLALMSSQMACGRVNTRVVQNIAIYQAARARGFDPRTINPNSGNFYSYLYRLGNPLTSPEFQGLAMQDQINSAEARANAAINQELSSTGMKALRSEKNNISRSSQTIVDEIQQAIGKAMDTAISASDSAFASAAGSILANMVTAMIFQNQGQLVVERAVCGLGTLAGLEVQKGGGIETGGVDKASILVNGGNSATVTKGESATLTWNVDIKDADGNPAAGTVNISNFPCSGAPAKTGSCNFQPVAASTTFELHFVDASGDQKLGEASVVVSEISIDFTASPNPSPAPGDMVTLSWQVSDPAASVDINGSFGNTSFTVTNYKGASGSVVVNPTETTTYTLVANKSGAEIGRQTLTVDVQQPAGGVGGESAGLSPGFKVRE